MLTKKKSGGVLSSLFSSGGGSSSNNLPDVPPVPPPHWSPSIPPSQTSPASNRLFKSNSHERNPSEQLLPPPAFPAAASATHRKPLPQHARKGSALLEPPVFDVNLGTRSASSPANSRPNSSYGGSYGGSRPTTPLSTRSGTNSPMLSYSPGPSPGPATPQSTKKVKRKSGGGLFGHSRHSSRNNNRPKAWILATPGQGQAEYDLTPLLHAQHVPELWVNDGDALIHLFPRTSDKGPSFRIPSRIFSASIVLNDLSRGHRVGSIGGRSDANRPAGTPSTPPMTPEMRAQNPDGSPAPRLRSLTLDEASDGPTHLYLPISLSSDGAVPTPGANEHVFTSEDVDELLAVRNTFAFLLGQSLIATERRPTAFTIFMQISEKLRYFGFSNLDGSTYGEATNSSFDQYVEELQLADVRASREKTIEAIVLGERMRSVMLYNEAFVHGVGKYDEIMKMKSAKFELVSGVTRNRMERASLDLSIRIQNIELRLHEFDFPAIFSGLMNSKTDDARRVVNFDAWRNSFNNTKRFFVNYYKHKYGSWPPKASSKKNSLETSGLNRLVLRDLYHDLSSVYDLLVDRNSLTTRGLGGAMATDVEPGDPEAHAKALRRVLDEYDKSTPPVQPAVPYDVPMFPSLALTRRDYGHDAAADAKARGRKLKDDELKRLLSATVNQDANASTPFLDAFKEHEHRAMKGRTIVELADVRCGAWIFLYAVLQALPMLVIDAPALRWTRRVEYFLCEPPRHGVPWARDDKRGGQRSQWYGVTGGSGGIVALPSDVIEHGIEGIYRRSHCWEMAAQWSAQAGVLAGAALSDVLNEPLPPPPGVYGNASDAGGSRPGTPGSQRSSVVDLGLEALPLGQGIAPAASPSLRPTIEVDKSKTFDAILGGAATAQSPVKGRKK